MSIGFLFTLLQQHDKINNERRLNSYEGEGK